MSILDSSFYRLFHRSREYRGPAADDDSSEAKALREQRERFAVAALAFCLKHDEAFRRSFWEQVCRVEDDPSEMPPVRDEDIRLEPPRWADLRLISDTPALGRFVWVVEAKAGAKLAQIQDPSQKEFQARGLGYGALFNASEGPQGTRMRYIVLGAGEVLNLPAKHPTLPIWLGQRHWQDVAKCKASKIVLDLFDALGALNIHPFAMNTAKSISVGRGLSGVGAAHDVLMAFYTWVGVKAGRREFEVYRDGGGSVAGIYIKQPPLKNPTAAHLQIQKLSDSENLLTWLGYITGPDDKVSRSVWIYFKSAKLRDQMLQKIKGSFPAAESQADGAYFIVSVESNESALKDLIWFHSVLQAAGITVPL